MKVDPRHPRFQSLTIRESLANAVRGGIVVPQGLIAHGRGEAFDYILGERTIPSASRATAAAAALLLSAREPVLSVNGNTAALVGKEIVKLASQLPASIEVNLFHRSLRREQAIAHLLKRLGARDILGIGSASRISIAGVSSPRKRVDPRGIASADVVLVPLEDGDRAEALQRAGKRVIAIDLNPLSRTARVASISIIDNVVRALPNLTRYVLKMGNSSPSRLRQMASSFDNESNLDTAIGEIVRYLRGLRKN